MPALKKQRLFFPHTQKRRHYTARLAILDGLGLHYILHWMYLMSNNSSVALFITKHEEIQLMYKYKNGLDITSFTLSSLHFSVSPHQSKSNHFCSLTSKTNLWLPWPRKWIQYKDDQEQCWPPKQMPYNRNIYFQKPCREIPLNVLILNNNYRSMRNAPLKYLNQTLIVITGKTGFFCN